MLHGRHFSCCGILAKDRRSLPGAIHDQELVLEEKGLRN